MQQQTIHKAFTLEGVTLHTGTKTSVTLCPAGVNTGIRIRRMDLAGEPEREALACYVSTTNRGTKLQDGDWSVGTLEHMMAALYALGITNCLVKLNGAEVPILDGSAQPYVTAINEVGIDKQDAEVKTWIVKEPIRFEDGMSSLTIEPADRYEMAVTVDYKCKAVGKQTAQLTHLSEFAKEIAPARTFCFLKEILPLLCVGLIKGGSLRNALVLSNWGPLSDLRYPNEPARHKLLDLIGDLALSGVYIQGKITAVCPGHRFNTNCCRGLMESGEFGV